MKYEVNKRTLAIIPTGISNCKILENKNSYDLNVSSFKVIEHSCEYFGVSYYSRVAGSKLFTKSRYKNPIIIQESARLIFFPITSPSRTNTIWISYNNIDSYFKSRMNKNNTTIKFNNGYKMEVPISFYSFNNQFLKAARLSASLYERIFSKN